MTLRLSLLSSANSSGRASRFDPQGERGVSLVEALVSIVLASLIGGMVVGASMVNRAIYQKDLARTWVNQSLRGALHLIGTEIRQAGEYLPASFPSIEIINGGSATTPDTLILRRNLHQAVLFGCDAKAVGTSNNRTALSRTSPLGPSCTTGNQAPNAASWTTYVDAQSVIPEAFLFNRSTRLGEFVKLVEPLITTHSGIAYVNYESKVLANPYPAENHSLYLLNEWRMELASGLLQITENRDSASTQHVADSITNFQVSAILADGTVADTFLRTDDWTTLRGVRVTISGATRLSGGKRVAREVTGDFLPRNVLSN